MSMFKHDHQIAKFLYFGVPAISILLLDSGVTDPVNAPKFFLLGVVSFGLLALLVSRTSFLIEPGVRMTLLLVGTFMVISTLVLFSSEAPLVQSLYGVYGRNNGYLTYLFLSIVLISASTVRSTDFGRKLSIGLLSAGLLNLIYCGWVIIFGDFLSWYNPYKNILGTFGNPNFIGAFLGIFGSALFAFAVAPETSKRNKIICLLLIPITLWEVMASHAVQGRALLASGFVIVGFFWVRSKFNNLSLTSAYILGAIILGGLSLAGALQKGPFVSIIYKTSVSLRGQYWQAGWNTGLSNPLNGVGFDSFGDWYRRSRDIRAITLPGTNTVVNTSHNVPLDIFAFGGWPLFIAYLLLVIYVGLLIVKMIRKNVQYDLVLVCLVVAWTGYQLQSIISINQIGLAVWGWALSGAIIAYSRISPNGHATETVKSKQMSKKGTSQNSVISGGLISGVGCLIGALIAVPPLSADMKWMSARESRSVEALERSLVPSYLNPQNSFKYVGLVSVFEGNALFDLSHKYALESVRFNPSSYDSWRQLYFIKNSTAAERELALENMKRLDPLNPDVTAE